jgi:hypothetical protein
LRTFRVAAPFGTGLHVDQPLAGADVDRLHVVDVDLRDAAGRARHASDVEAEVEAHVEAALATGSRVLVHAMDASKTGLRCPGPGWVRRWRRRHPDDLRVVVDSAQARSSRRRVREHLAAGAAVFTTGSKAIGAPPFCGVLVLDDGLLADAARCGELPVGLALAVARGDLPPVLARRASAFEPVNLGLLARWEVGLAEWERLDTLPRHLRRAVTGALLDGWRRGLAELPGVDVLPCAPDAVPTVVSFRVGDGAGGWLGKAAMADLHARVTAEPGVYLGQAVELVRGGQAVLRVAVGAPTVTRMVERAGALGGVDRAVAEAVGITVDRLAGGLPVPAARR